MQCYVSAENRPGFVPGFSLVWQNLVKWNRTRRSIKVNLVEHVRNRCNNVVLFYGINMFSIDNMLVLHDALNFMKWSFAELRNVSRLIGCICLIDCHGKTYRWPIDFRLANRLLCIHNHRLHHCRATGTVHTTFIQSISSFMKVYSTTTTTRNLSSQFAFHVKPNVRMRKLYYLQPICGRLVCNTNWQSC